MIQDPDPWVNYTFSHGFFPDRLENMLMRSSPFSGKIKRLFSVCLFLSVLIALLLPVSVSAAESQVRTVKVGFFAFEGYHEMDDSGSESWGQVP